MLTMFMDVVEDIENKITYQLQILNIVADF